jgi:DNA-binding phage protein
MKNVKAPTSISYHPYLISKLKDPNFAGVYLETHFEEDEQPEPELLKLALGHVLEALGESKMTTEQVQSQSQKLDELLSQPGNQSIYALAAWLNALGLKLTVVPSEKKMDRQES